MSFTRITIKAGFTMLEICIAMAIAVLVITMAIPSLSGVLEGNRTEKSFLAFDDLVQEAHSKSLAEHKPYLVVWTREAIVLRADDGQDGQDGQKGKATELRRVDLVKEEPMTLFLTAALVKKPDAVWTFWPGGACEPATVTYKGKSGKWSAVYNPFTAEAVVHYD